jgi:hypothetical protein
MRRHEFQRAQAFTETLIFIPLFLVMLYAVLYFGQVGVKQERVQTAIRYGVNTLPVSNLQIEQVYQTFQNWDSTAGNVPMPGLTPVPCPTGAATQTQLAFNQAQTNPATAPSAQPYWQMSAPTISCNVTFLPVANVPDMYNTGMFILEETSNQITGSVAAQKPGLLNFLPGSYSVTGSYNGYLPASINDMIACTEWGSGGHGTTTGFGMAMALAQGLNPGTSTTGKSIEPFYGGYSPAKGSALCNSG